MEEFSEDYILNSWKSEEAREKNNFKPMSKEELLETVKGHEGRCLLKRPLRKLSISKGTNGSNIRVMQWNTLAQGKLCLIKIPFFLFCIVTNCIKVIFSCYTMYTSNLDYHDFTFLQFQNR